MRHLWMLGLLGACANEPVCDGLDPKDGTKVSFAFATFDGLADTDGGFDVEGTNLLRSDDAWQTATDGWGQDWGLTPDFARDAVFVNAWTYGGCGEGYDYAAWRWGDVVRVRATYWQDPAGVCDAWMPTVDLLQVDLDGATDVAWCE